MKTSSVHSGHVMACVRQRAVESTEASVDVADGEVAACGIGRYATHGGGAHDRLAGGPSARTEGPISAVTYWAQASMTGTRRLRMSERR